MDNQLQSLREDDCPIRGTGPPAGFPDALLASRAASFASWSTFWRFGMPEVPQMRVLGSLLVAFWRPFSLVAE